MKVNKGITFALAITLQVAIVASIIVFKLAVLARGTDVVLKIAPVDPRDWLRGDYAVFRYDISEIPPYFLRDKDLDRGDQVFVSLAPRGKYWNVVRVQKEKPTKEGALFIKGVAKSNRNISYGIEQFFIPEGKGKGFSFAGKESAARVSIDKNGNAVLKTVYVNGEIWP